MRPPHLDFAPFVSREHGDVFAESVFEQLEQSDIISEAFSRTKIIGWPGEDEAAAVDRYRDLADEIRRLAFELTKRHLAEAFATVGAFVLSRERDR
jgi:hypothetical protein